MSVIIKSNNVAVNNLGPAKMLGKTPQGEFDKYKLRVLADGGVIKNEARTLSAFELLFTSKMYGNMNTAVSGTFGVKTNGAGGITKLYAVDGEDMIGTVFGDGTLPTLTANNNITFAANNSDQFINGAIFTTATPLVLSKAGNFGYAVSIKKMGAITVQSTEYIAEISKHAQSLNAINALLYQRFDTKTVFFNMQKPPFLNGVTNTGSPVGVDVGAFNYPTVSVITDKASAKKYGFRGGIATDGGYSGATFPEITTEAFFIDFGGAYHSDKKWFGSFEARDFMCFNHVSKEQARQISAFTA